MNLAIDIGNSRTKTAIFHNGEIIKIRVWDSFGLRALHKTIKEHRDIQRIIVSSVTLVSQSLEKKIRKDKRNIILSSNTNVPIKNKYKTPKTLGNDRLAAIVGAKVLYPKDACLVIDAGTCIKYDYISKRSHYYGGTISPGMNMRLEAMHKFTSKLPLLELSDYMGLFGRNTEESMITGAQLAAILEMEGFIDRYTKKYGNLKVILTGGDADFFAKRLKRKIFVRAELILIGLDKILKHNVLKT